MTHDKTPAQAGQDQSSGRATVGGNETLRATRSGDSPSQSGPLDPLAAEVADSDNALNAAIGYLESRFGMGNILAEDLRKARSRLTRVYGKLEEAEREQTILLDAMSTTNIAAEAAEARVERMRVALEAADRVRELWGVIGLPQCVKDYDAARKECE